MKALGVIISIVAIAVFVYIYVSAYSDCGINVFLTTDGCTQQPVKIGG